jgi:hypothetical protein
MSLSQSKYLKPMVKDKTMKAEAWQVTPKAWATGFDIILNGESEEWTVHMCGLRKGKKYLFTGDDRRRMNEMRDEIVAKINHVPWYRRIFK